MNSPITLHISPWWIPIIISLVLAIWVIWKVETTPAWDFIGAWWCILTGIFLFMLNWLVFFAIAYFLK